MRIGQAIRNFAYQQSRRRGHRQLTIEEKQESYQNFITSLQKDAVKAPKIRNLISSLRKIAANAVPPSPIKGPENLYTAHEDILDQYGWIQQVLLSNDDKLHDLEEYIGEELQYTAQVTAPTLTLIGDLHNEFQSRSPVPLQYQRVQAMGHEYYIEDDVLYRTSGDQVEAVLHYEELQTSQKLQGNAGFQNVLKHDRFPLVNTQFSSDHRYVAALLQTEVSNVLVVKDTQQNQLLDFAVEHVDEFFVFDQKQGLYYVILDNQTNKGKQVYRVQFNEQVLPPDDELGLVKVDPFPVRLEYSEKDPSYTVDGNLYTVQLTLNKEYILIVSEKETEDFRLASTETRFRASNKSDGEWLMIQPREEGHHYLTKCAGDSFYILSVNQEHPNGRILKLKIPPLYTYSPPESWEEAETKDVQSEFLGAETIIEERPGITIEQFEALQDYLFLILMSNDSSLQYLQTYNFNTNDQQPVLYENSIQLYQHKSYRVAPVTEMLNYYSPNIPYKLQTLHAPTVLLNYNLESRTTNVIGNEYYHPDIKLEQLDSERIVLPANDGVMIPVTLVYNKKTVGSDNTILVYTQGGLQTGTHDFEFDYKWVSLLERKFILAIPHLRGSSDITRSWYLQGAGSNKARHLQDLLDVSVSLIGEKIGSKICAYGSGPSGGLAVAAVIMKEPEVFQCSVIRNPITDVFRFLSMQRQNTEFGDYTQKEQFQMLKGISPYYSPVPKFISPLMVTADIESERCLDALKFVMKLRASNELRLLYKEFPTWMPDNLKFAEELGFILDHTL